MRYLLSALVLLGSWFLPASSQTAAPSDPNYQALRQAAPNRSYLVENLEIVRDLGQFRFRSGHITFLEPVLDHVTTAVFVGEGTFSFAPPQPWEQRNLQLFIEQDEVSEDFRRAVLVFTDETAEQIADEANPVELDPEAADVLDDFRRRTRRRSTDGGNSELEALLTGEDMDNIAADVLADLYDPPEQGAFSAYLFGRTYDDLRFHVRPRAGLPQIDSNEDVALVHLDPGGNSDGIWYLSHLESERQSGQLCDDQDKRVIDVVNYAIDTEIEGDRDIRARCDLRFRAVDVGARVIKFGLLPALRVSEALLDGVQIPFIQEPEDEDGSLYVVLPEPLAGDRDYEITLSYAGKKVIGSAGGGNYYVRARTSWYPSVNSFRDSATFELTFRYPKKSVLVSVGDRVEDTKDGDRAYSKWTSDVPIPVAGFNYGRFKRRDVSDKDIGYEIEGFAGTELPDIIRRYNLASELPSTQGRVVGAPPRISATPTKMMERTMAEAQVALRIYTDFYGPTPFKRIAITQQADAFYGQSWPSLVYLPATAFLDQTQRWMLWGSSSFSLTEFVQEVTAHEVAHQWWGHIVGWDSYHDQWISEGFADFSAQLYVIATSKDEGKPLQFLERWREAILQKNRFGFAPNDAGPIWMGRRLTTPRTPNAYGQLVYAKGGFIIHMLRQMMATRESGDQAFKAMMKEFVSTNLHQNASTADFQAVAEKHLPPHCDLSGDGRLDWFFRQWVHGIEIPAYNLRYSLTPTEGGKVLLRGVVTQKGVSENFAMPVPVYLVFKGGITRLGRVNVAGSTSSQPFEVELPQRPERVLLNYYQDILATESTSNEVPSL